MLRDIGKDEPCYVRPENVVAVLPNPKGFGSLVVLDSGIHPLASNLTPAEVESKLFPPVPTLKPAS